MLLPDAMMLLAEEPVPGPSMYVRCAHCGLQWHCLCTVQGCLCVALRVLRVLHVLSLCQQHDMLRRRLVQSAATVTGVRHIPGINTGCGFSGCFTPKHSYQGVLAQSECESLRDSSAALIQRM